MAKDKQDYRTMMAELQDILAAMQSDDLDVDEALRQYERGQQLIAELTQYLAVAENKITVRKNGD